MLGAMADIRVALGEADGAGGEVSVLGIAGPEHLDPGAVREPKMAKSGSE